MYSTVGKGEEQECQQGISYKKRSFSMNKERARIAL